MRGQLRVVAVGMLALTLAFGAAALPSLLAMRERGVDILAYELAGTTRRATELNALLGAAGREDLRSSLLWDFPFLVAYGLCLAAMCLLVAVRARLPGRRSPSVSRR